jgi:hypothetical protein
LYPTQTNYRSTASGVSTEYGLIVKTDKSKEFSAVFSAVMRGAETILTIDGPGVRRMRIRVAIGDSLTENDKRGIRRFFADGIDCIIDAKRCAKTESMRKEIEAAAVLQANEMVTVMARSVMDFIRDEAPSIELKSSEPVQRPRSKKVGQGIIGQVMILAMSRSAGRYVRFNCIATISPANHVADIDEMQNAQEVIVTITEAETGSGPNSTIQRSGISLEPLAPSKEELSEAVSRAMAGK